MSDIDEVAASFNLTTRLLSGDAASRAVTRIGLRLVDSDNRGDARTRWILLSPLPKEMILEEHLRWLLARVERAADELDGLGEADCEFWFDCRLRIHLYRNDNQGLDLDPQTIGRIARLNAAFRVEIYCLREA
jgi:hypothetical protein